MKKEDLDKKTERLDIRVSHNKKQAFTRACEDQGDTPSNAIRRFITTYIRRARQDNIFSHVRYLPWRRVILMSGSVAALGLGAVYVVNIHKEQKAVKLAGKVFNIYDQNNNGLLEPGEILPTDFHLHRVLDIDGKTGISPREFVTHGKMVWNFIDPENHKVIKVEKTPSRQMTVIRSARILKTDENGEPIDIDKVGKRYIRVDGEYVELENDEMILEHLGSIDQDYEQLRRDGHLKGSRTQNLLKKFNPHLVEFDLRDPNNFQLTAFEITHFGLHASLSGHQRSVTWVEGRETPEQVLGMDYEIAVLTEDGE